MATYGDDQVGRVLGGRYRLLAPVGTGASATVYLAEDTGLRRQVAVKVLHPVLADDPVFLKRFRAEAQAAAALSHPHIVAVYDWGEDRGTPYLVTEFLAGGSLRSMLDVGRRLSPSQALLVGLDACKGLDYAHRRGFVHRDIKPANLLFGDDRRLRIADFGLARAIAEAAWTEPAGVVLGTARYASPEQAKGQPVDGRSDVYSLVLTLVEAITGKVPFAADTTVATLMNRIDKLLPVTADLGPLAAVLERAGRPDPDERYDAAAFGRALVQTAEKLPRPEPLRIVPSLPFGLPRDLTTLAEEPPSLPPPAGSPPPGATPTVRIEAATAAAAALAVGPASTPTPPPGDNRPTPPAVPESSVEPAAAAAEEPDPATPSPDEPNRAAGGEPEELAPGRPVAPPDALEASVAGENDAAEPPTVALLVPFDDELTEVLPASGGPGGSMTPSNGSSPATQTLPVAPVVAVAPAEVGAAPAEPPRRRWPRRLLWIVLSLVVIGALVAGGVVLYQRTRTPSYPVPDLTGLAEAQALNLIAPNDWEVEVLRERTDDAERGRVFRQSVSTGKLEEGQPFTIWVSAGPTLSPLPDLVGLSADVAGARLDGLGFTLAVAEERFDEEAPTGQVLDWSVDGQRLAVGTEIEKGSTVDVVLSKGPQPRTVPEVVGVPFEEAVAALERLGLVVQRGDDAFSDTVAPGVVIAVSPGVGESVAKGAPVVVVVSKGQDVVTVPPLAGLSLADAQAALQQAGLALGEVAGTADQRVVASSPASGTVVRRNTAVNLLLG